MPQHRAAGPAAARRGTGDLAGPAEGPRSARSTRPAHRRDTRSQRPLAGLLSTPVIAGTAALALASAGAVTAGAERSGAVPLPNRSVTTLSAASLSAVPAGTAPSRREAWAGRERALSRGADRAEQADLELQAAAETQARRRNAALAARATSAKKKARRLAALSWHLPVTRGAYHLTAGFGQCAGLWAHCHTGLDFPAAEGTPIHAVATGTITEVGWAGAYGNRTIEKLSNGTELWYAHQSSTSVRAGQKITGGQVIGSVGSTGNTTGPHVHLEVRPHPDHPVDPRTALVAHGVRP